MESPRGNQGPGHSAHPQIAGDAVNSTSVFTKDALTEVILEVHFLHMG